MPEHPTGQGAAFQRTTPEAFAELASWYANADKALKKMKASEARASEVRCWPHHFDLGSLITKDDTGAASVGFGFSPGDAPNFRELDGGGTWTTDGFFGAVLTASVLKDSGSAGAATEAFLKSAIEGAFEMIGGR